MITYTVQVDEIGNQFWYHGKELSRNDGPAAIFTSGDRKWYQNGLLHRLDGPAIEYANGDRAWFQNGVLHREYGPAIELSNGTKRWFIRGQELGEDSFNAVIRMADAFYQPAQSVEMTVEEICKALGKNVKIVKR